MIANQSAVGGGWQTEKLQATGSADETDSGVKTAEKGKDVT